MLYDDSLGILSCVPVFSTVVWPQLHWVERNQIPLGSSRHVSTRLDTFNVWSESRRVYRAVLVQHGGRRTSYSARLYNFSRFYYLT